MAESTFKKTTSIRESLIAFGQIEGSMAPASLNATHASLSESLNLGYPNQAYRLIDQLHNWLPDGTIEGSRRGQALAEDHVSDETYREFVAVLLALNAMKDGISQLLGDLSRSNLKAQGMMSTLSEVILAKDETRKTGRMVKLIYKLRGQTYRFRFAPKRLFLQKNRWYVEGDIIDPHPSDHRPDSPFKQNFISKKDPLKKLSPLIAIIER